MCSVQKTEGKWWHYDAGQTKSQTFTKAERHLKCKSMLTLPKFRDYSNNCSWKKIHLALSLMTQWVYTVIGSLKNHYYFHSSMNYRGGKKQWVSNSKKQINADIESIHRLYPSLEWHRIRKKYVSFITACFMDSNHCSNNGRMKRFHCLSHTLKSTSLVENYQALVSVAVLTCLTVPKNKFMINYIR